MIINANALSIPLADKSVQMIVTSPPYWGLRNYGVSGQLGLERTPEEYIANMLIVFRECWRVLRDDGTLWLNVGDSYYNYRPGYQSQSKQSLNGKDGKVIEFSSKRAERMDGIKEKDLVGIPWRLAFALQADGWYLRSDIIWNKPNPMPESVTDRPTKSHEYLFLLTKSQRYYYDAEAIKEENSPTSGKWGATNQHGKSDATKAKEIKGEHGKSSILVRQMSRDDALQYYINGRNRRSVWTIPTDPYKGAHFATFPPALVEPCIKAGTSERGACPKCGKGWRRVVEKPEGYPRGSYHDHEMDGVGYGLRHSGKRPKNLPPEMTNITTGWQPSCNCNAGEPIPCLVFDPFVGSGTTVKVAYDLGRRGVGLDLSLEYLDEQARKRIHNGHYDRLF